MHRFGLPTGGRVVVKLGDLAREEVDAVVNPADPSLLEGGGVDEALREGAGPLLHAACRRLPAIEGVRCAQGEARITPGFALPARFVIHTVGPTWGRSFHPEAELAAAVQACLRVAREHGLGTVAFPAISCGSTGFPPEFAARVMLRTIRRFAAGLDEVRLVLFGDETYAPFVAVARSVA